MSTWMFFVAFQLLIEW